MRTRNEEAVKSMQAMSGDVEATRRTLVMLPPRPVSPAEHGFVQLEPAGPLASAPLRNFLFYIKYGLGVWLSYVQRIMVMGKTIKINYL